MIKPITPACGEERIPLQAGDFLFCMQRRTCVAAACIMHAGEERPGQVKPELQHSKSARYSVAS